MNKQPSDTLAAVVLWAMCAVLVVLFLLSGCATTTRLNAGECLVIEEGKQIVTVGQNCQVRRFNR